MEISINVYLEIVVGEVQFADGGQIEMGIRKGIQRHPTQIHNLQLIGFSIQIPCLLLTPHIINPHLLLILVHHLFTHTQLSLDIYIYTQIYVCISISIMGQLR